MFLLFLPICQFGGIKETLVADKRVQGLKFKRKFDHCVGHHVPIQGWSDVQVRGISVLRRQLRGEPAQQFH